jgi:RimJ/RimL family protein N-acetyltransferase
MAGGSRGLRGGETWLPAMEGQPTMLCMRTSGACAGVAAPPQLLRAGAAWLMRWRDDDVDAVYEAVTGSLAHLLPWMAWARGYDRAAAAAFITACDQAWVAGRTYNYAIRAGAVDHPGASATSDLLDGQPAVDGVAGGCSLMRSAEDPARVGIGYWLRPEHVGRGLVTAAASALVTAAFELSGVDVVEIRHDAANHRSAAVPRRLGFTQIGEVLSTEPHTPARTGISVVWQTQRPAHPAEPRPDHT